MWHKYLCLFEAPGWILSLDMAGEGGQAGDSEVYLARRALDSLAWGPSKSSELHIWLGNLVQKALFDGDAGLYSYFVHICGLLWLSDTPCFT